MKYLLTIMDNQDNIIHTYDTQRMEGLEEDLGAFERSDLFKKIVKEEILAIQEAEEADKEVRRELEIAQLAGCSEY